MKVKLSKKEIAALRGLICQSEFLQEVGARRTLESAYRKLVEVDPYIAGWYDRTGEKVIA